MSWGVFGSILGAATNLWQSERARKDAKSQYAGTTLTARVNEAKRLGLSPLAVLGSPTASPTIMGSGQSDLGSHLKDVVSQIQKSQQQPKKPSFKNRDPLEVRAQLAEIRRLEAEAIMAEKRASNIALATSPGTPMPPPELTGPRGGKWQTSPSTTAETVEEQYGGLSGEIYGAHRAWQDKRSMDRKKPPPAYYKGTPKGTMPKGYPKRQQRKYKPPQRYGGF